MVLAAARLLAHVLAAVAALSCVEAARFNVFDYGRPPWAFEVGVPGSNLCFGHSASEPFKFQARGTDDPAVARYLSGHAEQSMNMYDYYCVCPTREARVCGALEFFSFESGLTNGMIKVTAQFVDTEARPGYAADYAVLSDEVKCGFNYLETRYSRRNDLREITPVFGPQGQFELGMGRAFHDIDDTKITHFFLNAGAWDLTRSRCFVPAVVSDLDLEAIESTARASGKGFTCQQFAAGAGKTELCAVTQIGSTISWVLQRDPDTKRVIDVSEMSVSAPNAAIGAAATKQWPLCDGYTRTAYFHASLDFQVNPAKQRYEIIVGRDTLLAAWQY
jgi:hypothetical protein